MATIADVFHRFAGEYLASHKVSDQQRKLIYDAQACRTAARGGHVAACNHCGVVKVFYNSCANRHCPACQGVNKEKWILERAYDQLPVKYFHLVFTVPSQLRPLFRKNKKTLYNVLLSCAWETLDTLSQDPRHRLMAKLGMIAVLHTWTQKLIYHPHVHCMVPAGGLDHNGKWKHTHDKFLFPVRVMANLFRGKMLFHIKQLLHSGQLKGSEGLSSIVRKLYNKKWVVYAKPSFQDHHQLFEYLGRYTHRIAISNYRIKAIGTDSVTFSYLDRADQNRKKLLTLPAEDFIYRYLNHVLPKGFVKIRHYGFLSTRAKGISLPLIREQLAMPAQQEKPNYKVRDVVMITKGIDIDLCTSCGQGVMVVIQEIPDNRGSPKSKLAC